MRTRTAAAVVAVLLLAGCATPRGGAPGGPPDADLPPGPSADPVELVNLWRVSGAAGEGPETWLRLEVGGYQLWRDCGGFVEGGWRATGRAFVASEPFAALGTCGSGEWPTVPWLSAAIAYEAHDDGWRLLGADGEVLATLSIDGAPEPVPNAADFYAEPPEVTDDVRAAFAEPAPLPDGMTPATWRDLVGRWTPTTWYATDPHVELAADGTWTGSDGCNGSGGAWRADEGGRLLVTAGVSTLVGCDGAPVGSWLASAARAGLEFDELVLLDAEGAEIARLMRG